MLICVGAGPGHLDYLTRRGARLIAEAEVVAGFEAVLDIVRPLLRPEAQVFTLTYANQTEYLAQVVALHHSGKACVVVFMGDIHFSGFQLLERVEAAYGGRIETVPGISSAQILASKTRVCFDDTTFFTFHRRGDLTPFKQHLLQVIHAGRNAIVIPRPWDYMPGDIAHDLLAAGLSGGIQAEVWENLTGAEAQWHSNLSELGTQTFSDMSILLLRALTAPPSGLEGEA